VVGHLTPDLLLIRVLRGGARRGPRTRPRSAAGSRPDRQEWRVSGFIRLFGGALGARGTLNYSIGYASLLNSWATSSVASDGILTNRTDGIGKTITDIGKRRTELETRLIAVEKRYRAQFTALDMMLSSMNTTSTFLTQQLESLNSLN